MANSSLAALESLLRTRHLDRTLTTTANGAWNRHDTVAVLPSDLPALDGCLCGGLPRGQLSELAGPPSSGRTTLLLQWFAATARRGEIAALVDTGDRLDVASATAAGIDLSRMLWIRGLSLAKTEMVVDRALKAFNLVLQAGGFGLVALDLADVPAVALSRLPATTWLRVQRVIEGTDTACLLVVPEPLARSAGGLTVRLGAATQWMGDAECSRRLNGLTITARVVSPRRHLDGEAHVRCGVRS